MKSVPRLAADPLGATAPSIRVAFVLSSRGDFSSNTSHVGDDGVGVLVESGSGWLGSPASAGLADLSEPGAKRALRVAPPLTARTLNVIDSVDSVGQ